jgi:hypothetical protein
MRANGRLLSLVFVFALPACSFHYVPQEYPVDVGAIQPIDLVGTVSVVNAQPSMEPVTVMQNWAGPSYLSDLHTVTEATVQQTTKEIAKNTRKGDGSAKTIDLAVFELKSYYITFYWTGHISYTAKLGSGKTIAKEVGHAPADPQSDLNRAIANGVVELLNDPDLRQYLASP